MGAVAASTGLAGKMAAPSAAINTSAIITAKHLHALILIICGLLQLSGSKNSSTSHGLLHILPTVLQSEHKKCSSANTLGHLDYDSA
jgi:hypothetical protein